MIDESPSDRSRFYSVADLAQEFSLTSQGHEEEGLIMPGRVGLHLPGPRPLVLIQKLRRQVPIGDAASQL